MFNIHLNIVQYSFVLFLHFWQFLAIFGIFGVSVGVGRVWGVLVSYKITTGIKLVVKKVNDWV